MRESMTINQGEGFARGTVSHPLRTQSIVMRSVTISIGLLLLTK